MEKLRTTTTPVAVLQSAYNALESLDLDIDCMESLSFLLWQSLAEYSTELDRDIHGNAAYMLNKQIEQIHEALHGIEEAIHAGLEAVKA